VTVATSAKLRQQAPTDARLGSLVGMTRSAEQPKNRAARSGALVAGASSISVVGSGRVNRLVRSVLAENGFERDAKNLRGDFARAIDSARRKG
jgi:hypothetical protein